MQPQNCSFNNARTLRTKEIQQKQKKCLQSFWLITVFSQESDRVSLIFVNSYIAHCLHTDI